MERPEAEEGETRYCEENEDGTRVDPDKDFSHLDTKIESGVSALKLGTKIGRYGSFLPPCQYSPSAWCHLDSPQQFPKHCKSSSPDRSSTPDRRPPPSAVPFAVSEVATCDSHFLDSSRLPASDLSIKHDLFSTSSRAIEQFPVEQGTSNKPANPTNKRNLKFRIKVGSNSLSQKSAAVFSGLGLNISPSTSPEKNHGETRVGAVHHNRTLKQSSAGGIPVQFSESLNQPTSIIQIMTSFPVTGEKILSPLNADFLSLTGKATPDGYDKPTVDLRVTQRQNDIPVNESSRRRVGVKAPKDDNVKLEPNHGIGKKVNNAINSSSQEKTNHGTLVGRECSSSGMKPKLLAKLTSSERNSTKGSSLMCGATKKLNKGTSPGIVMDDSYELMSAQSGCGEKQKAGDCSSGTNMDRSVDIRNDGSAENNRICAQFKARFDKSQSEEISNVRLIQPSMQKIVKRKSCKSKMQTLNSQNNIYKVGNKQRDSLRNAISGVMDKQVVLAQRPLGEDSMDSGPKAASKEQNTLFTKSKEQRCKGNERKFALEGTLEVVANTDTQLAVGPFTSENAASTEINDNWVQCDNCKTWRLFPSDIKPEQLPDKWMCSMQHWLSGMNHCDISMEDGIIAFYALNRPPVLEAQTSMHDPASGTATGINFDNIQQLGSCHHDPSSDFMQNGRKEDPESKKIPKSHQHESAKPRSLHMKQCHPESNPIKKPSSPLSSITVAKRTDLQKRNVKQINGGVAKQTGQKSKREADESVYGAYKKTRQEGDADLMKVGVNSRSRSSLKTSGKHMQQHNELSYSKDARGKILRQKQSDCHVSLDGHMDGCKDNFNAKKRKLKDSLDGKVFAEVVSIEDGFNKERKSLMNLRSKESNTIKGDCKSSKKCRVSSRMPSTGSAENPFVSKERVKKSSNNERPMKQSKIFSQGMNSLERDLVSNAASGIAASGSSMISSSHKSKVSFQQVKGSPVESVSSSPFRASVLKNISPVRKGTSENDDATDGCLFLTCTPRRYPAVKHNGEKRLSASYDSLNLCEKLVGQHSYAIKSFCDADKSNAESRSEKVKCHLMEGVSFDSKTDVRDSIDVHPLGCHFNKGSCSEQCENNGSKDEKKGLVKNFFLGRCSNDRVTVNEANRRVNIEAGNISDQIFESRVLSQQTLSNSCDKPKRLVLGSQSVPGLQKCGDAAIGDVSGDNNVSSLPKQHMGLVASNGCGQNAPIPLRNDFSLTADESLQKAKELQESADFLKSFGFAFESNEVCFQCGLQFLHGISLLETCSGENIRHGDMNQIQLYSRTAKIFGSCAHEYERCNELVAAALAYKCVEVAYMRIVSCRHSSTDQDLHELQAALQMLPNGESPGSSLSDADNLNIQAAVDKAALSKETNSHDAGSHVFIAQNHSNVIRLLDFAQKVNSGMEASRKTQKAFAAAKEMLKQSSDSDVIASVQKAISFSFQDVEGLVRLVKGAISRAGFGGRKD